jgi:hypothetical protein
VLPRVPMAPGSAFLRGELRCCQVSHGSRLWLPERGAPVPPHVSWPPGGLWTTGIKKGLAALGAQLGLRASKACLCVTEAPTRRADFYSAAER